MLCKSIIWFNYQLITMILTVIRGVAILKQLSQIGGGGAMMDALWIDEIDHELRTL